MKPILMVEVWLIGKPIPEIQLSAELEHWWFNTDYRTITVNLVLIIFWNTVLYILERDIEQK